MVTSAFWPERSRRSFRGLALKRGAAFAAALTRLRRQLRVHLPAVTSVSPEFGDVCNHSVGVFRHFRCRKSNSQFAFMEVCGIAEGVAFFAVGLDPDEGATPSAWRGGADGDAGAWSGCNLDVAEVDDDGVDVEVFARADGAVRFGQLFVEVTLGDAGAELDWRETVKAVIGHSCVPAQKYAPV